MIKSKEILGLMIHEPPWQYYVKYKRYLQELEHPFLLNINFLTDSQLKLNLKDLDKYKVVVFFYHDPLKQLYPRIYRYAKKIDSYCKKKGIIMLNNPEALSLSQKSIQLNILKKNNFKVAETYAFNSWKSLLVAGRLKYPIFFRYDLGHDSLGEGFTEPFYSRRKLIESKIWEEKKWDKSEHLKNVVAVRWVDTKNNDGFYRKYRVFVFGQVVLNGHIQVSNHWFVHGHNAILNKKFQKDNNNFIKRHCTAKEEKIFLKINKVLGLDFSAIDYSYDRKGNIVIWEANPHPSLGEWVDTHPFKKNFTNELSKFYKSKLE